MFGVFRRNKPTDDNLKAAAELAVGLVEGDADCIKAVESSLRAEEPDRWVFAVFYERRLPSCPTPYRLVSVRKPSGPAIEVGNDEFEKYCIRGRK